MPATCHRLFRSDSTTNLVGRIYGVVKARKPGLVVSASGVSGIGAIPASQPTRSQPRPGRGAEYRRAVECRRLGQVNPGSRGATAGRPGAVDYSPRRREVQPQPASPADACSCRSWSVWKNSTLLSRSTSKHQAARHCACCYRRARRAAGFATRQACRIAKLPDRGVVTTRKIL